MSGDYSSFQGKGLKMSKTVYTEYNFGTREQEIDDTRRVMTISVVVIKEVAREL